MIYVHHYTKNKDSFFAENNKQQSLNREIEINLAEEGTLIGWHKSYLIISFGLHVGKIRKISALWLWIIMEIKLLTPT